MKYVSIGLVKQIVKALLYALVGGFLVLMVTFVLYLESRPDLSVWHQAELDAEFTADAPVRRFADYLALEARLFEQLDERVYAKIPPKDRNPINRYHRGSLSDPERGSPNWNRSFELITDVPKAGVLLLHGLSDSPYSLRSLGERLHSAGARVLGLRIPGHGTAPSGLITVRWQDMAAAVRLAVRHLREQIGELPLYIVGYSNGGALAVHYALTALADADADAFPPVSGLVLISPAIGITPLAALAVWQARLGRLLGLDKLAWTDILPEYDPFKYGSFAVNAGDLEYRLTHEIQARLDRLGGADALKRFPPVLAFQSAVDATVSAPALVKGLFARLPAGDHELVLFDLNRVTDIEAVLREDPRAAIETLLQDANLALAISLVSNENEHSARLVVRHKKPGENELSESALDMSWPEGLYSLAHVALPFPWDDPVYGGDDAGDSSGIRLGRLALRGERGVLQIPAADLLRLRSNPFYPYLERRLLEFVGLAASSGLERGGD